MNRCLNDIFGYCGGQPEPITIHDSDTFLDLAGQRQTHTYIITSCKLATGTCGHYLAQVDLPLNRAGSFNKPNSEGTIE